MITDWPKWWGPIDAGSGTKTIAVFIAGCLALAAGAGAFPVHAEIGQAVEVIPQARHKVDGTVRVLEVGNQVKMGDIVATGRTGEAQLVFPDDTKIVVGPNSQLKLDRIVFKNSGTARRFTVSAIGGTFRFISGNSPSRAYRVRTPTATMGVRGTAFDFAVEGRDTTDLVVYDGAVQFCGRGARCATIPPGCSAVKVNNRSRFSQPETQGERLGILQTLFPYAINQDGLQPQFRIRVGDCGSDGDGDSAARQSRRTITAETRLPQLNLPEGDIDSIRRNNRGGGGGDSAPAAQPPAPNP